MSCTIAQLSGDYTPSVLLLQVAGLEVLALSSGCNALTLHVVPQHELLGVGMEVDLLVHPIGHWVAAWYVSGASGARSVAAIPAGSPR